VPPLPDAEVVTKQGYVITHVPGPEEVMNLHRLIFTKIKY
jgi:hypothetical protein